ncbi:response regulator [Pelagicoccus sp. SDUM812003]|uniref:response regulator n=1 Tax=Pelagicoccus sp. SDUM812003 TaxID=3041267 RepID=UPI00280DF137|nr:response regulator [Pelagicoccus sp. SDUM812003]MDQ8204948.1 response regulator [Pelagicoccus sp. SDUM812003]
MHDPRSSSQKRRVLIIDDTSAIHRDFEKVLTPSEVSENEQALEELDELMFADEEEPEKIADRSHKLDFELSHAYQGEEGLRKVEQAQQEGAPFSVAFVDMRMPPGWDGLKTVAEIAKADPHIQLVICSAYSDYSWSQIIDRLGRSDRLLILKKPFDHAEAYQLATALSEKWLAEARTRSLLSDLESKVESRTFALSESNAKLRILNEELKRAAEEARCSERAKGRFLATMSHEIRTTLNGIIGASNILSTSKGLSESDLELATIIQTSGDALMIVINDILDYSKYENGQLELESIPFSLRALAKECASLLAPSIEQNQVRFRMNLPDALPESLVGDPARLRQIMLNLLNNALKFGKGTEVDLSVAILEERDNAAALRIDVSDKGIGMDEETRSRLFSAFMQADSSTTRKFGGTGLGLAICKLLADAMDADLRAESSLGQGSTFSLTLTLPISDSTEDDHPSRQESKRVSHSASRSFEGRQVLLVDDNVINRKLGARFLERLKVNTSLAVDGYEALKAVECQSYDLILMDLQMPGIDGFEATRQLRAFEREQGRERIPVIALTANAFAEIRDQSLEAGMDDFLTKPLHIEDLSSVLDRWIGEGAKP